MHHVHHIVIDGQSAWRDEDENDKMLWDNENILGEHPIYHSTLFSKWCWVLLIGLVCRRWFWIVFPRVATLFRLVVVVVEVEEGDCWTGGFPTPPPHPNMNNESTLSLWGVGEESPIVVVVEWWCAIS